MTLIASWSVFILHTHTLSHSHYAILSIISHMIHTSIYIYAIYTQYTMYACLHPSLIQDNLISLRNMFIFKSNSTNSYIDLSCIREGE